MGGHAEAMSQFTFASGLYFICRPGRHAAPRPHRARCTGSDTGKRNAPPPRRVVSLEDPVAGSNFGEPSGDADRILREERLT
jgi:hypothetical protein